MKKHLPNLIGYLAPKNYENNLRKELQLKNMRIEREHGRLFLVEKTLDEQKQKIFWQQNTWNDLYEMEIESIKQCANSLKKIHKQWYHYSPILHLRCKLIQDNLPHIKIDDFSFPITNTLHPLAHFSLLDKNLVLFSSQTTSKFPNGEILFNEDRVNPPNRAYLKLWEVFSLIGKHPQKNESIIELGASPGGWTWVLQQLKTNIISCDKSPLDPRLMKYKKLKFIQQDAFKILPEDQKDTLDWLLSDLICYPDKLLQYVKIWIESNKVNNIICTLKFQGDIDYSIIEEFNNIPYSQIYHLSANKNELTFVWSKQNNIIQNTTQ